MRTLRTDASGNPIFGRTSSVTNNNNHHRRFLHRARKGGNAADKTNLQQQAKTPKSASQLTDLYGYARGRAWNCVLHRAQTHPSEIVMFCEGELPLHAACRFNAPSNVIHALLPPKISTSDDDITNQDGWHPLHIAASRHCSARVLQVLLQYNPTAVAQVTPTTQRTPLHFACSSFRRMDRDAFFFLLDASAKCQPPKKMGGNDNDGQKRRGENLKLDGDSTTTTTTSTNVLAMKDSQGHTPLALLFVRYRERVKNVCLLMDSTNNMTHATKLALVQHELGFLWDKAQGLVERLSAELSNSKQEEGDANATTNSPPFSLVHASVKLIAFGCHPEMIRLALSLYPDQASKTDADGNLPLHLAALAYEAQALSAAASASSDDDSSCCVESLVNAWEVASETTADSSMAGFSQRKSAWDQVFDMLLQCYPEAARTPQRPPHSKEGDQEVGPLDTLPLVLAMRSSCANTIISWRADGLERIMHAYPPALHIVFEKGRPVDPKYYPHLFALLLKQDWAQIDAFVASRSRFRTPRSMRMSRQRTPLDRSRMSAVYSLLQTKSEMVHHALTTAAVAQLQEEIASRISLSFLAL